MELSQAKGYFFEEIVKELLGKTNYIQVDSGILPGRGANHQIDSYGTFAFNIPFIYPVRLIAETKWYDQKIGLPRLRNFVGVMKDISENYFVPVDDRNRPNLASLRHRYTDCGAFFSVTDFSLDAQNYAYAHGIYLITFSQNSRLSPLIEEAKSIITQVFQKTMNRNQINKIFELSLSDNENFSHLFNQVVPYIGILDGVYPVLLTADSCFNFTNELDDDLSINNFGISDYAYKNFRQEGTETIGFNVSYQDTTFEFTLPTSIGQNIITSMEKTYRGDPFSKIEIPVELEKYQKRYRRIFTLRIANRDRSQILNSIKSFNPKKDLSEKENE